MIVAVDGTAIASPRDLQRIIAATPVGTTLPVALLREGQPREVSITVGRFPEDDERPRRFDGPPDP